MKTIAQLAIDSGRLASSLTRVARRLHIPRTGRDYALTAAQARQILGALRDGPGCPEFGKKYRGRKPKTVTT